jgi:hypothetical protein
MQDMQRAWILMCNAPGKSMRAKIVTLIEEAAITTLRTSGLPLPTFTCEFNLAPKST